MILIGLENVDSGGGGMWQKESFCRITGGVSVSGFV